MSAKLNNFLCLIALKLSNKYEFMLKTSYKTQSVMSVKVNSWERNQMFILGLCNKRHFLL